MTSVKRVLSNYAERHLHTANRVLHLVGVPLTFGVSVACAINDRMWLAAACFVAGYILQFIGHAIEGNDPGEVMLIKRMLGRPFEEFGPSHPSRQM